MSPDNKKSSVTARKASRDGRGRCERHGAMAQFDLNKNGGAGSKAAHMISNVMQECRRPESLSRASWQRTSETTRTPAASSRTCRACARHYRCCARTEKGNPAFTRFWTKKECEPKPLTAFWLCEKSLRIFRGTSLLSFESFLLLYTKSWILSPLWNPVRIASGRQNRPGKRSFRNFWADRTSPERDHHPGKKRCHSLETGRRFARNSFVSTARRRTKPEC